MKINILYDFNEKKTGGGSHFLTALRKKWIEQNNYCFDPENADVILVNSHHYVEEALNLKINDSSKIFVHRIDGPMRLYNFFLDRRDELVKLLDCFISSGTIFQSDWSRIENQKRGINKQPLVTIISNAVDENIFYSKGRVEKLSSKKVRLISTCWSENWKKGFKIYRWMDNNLDFDKYEMIFIGRSPIKFKNIMHVKSASRDEIANKLRQSDIYIAPSQKDPCSNALLEALACGLPVVMYQDGGHPEIVKKAGIGFQKSEEIPNILDIIKNEYFKYQNNIQIPSLDFVANQYYEFCQKVYQACRTNSQYLNALDVNDYKCFKRRLSFIKFQRSLPIVE